VGSKIALLRPVADTYAEVFGGFRNVLARERPAAYDAEYGHTLTHDVPRT
jgi:hypothetical protein